MRIKPSFSLDRSSISIPPAVFLTVVVLATFRSLVVKWEQDLRDGEMSRMSRGRSGEALDL